MNTLERTAQKGSWGVARVADEKPKIPTSSIYGRICYASNPTRLDLPAAAPLFEDPCLEFLGIKEPRYDSITIENPSFKCIHRLQGVSALFKAAMYILHTLNADS